MLAARASVVEFDSRPKDKIFHFIRGKHSQSVEQKQKRRKNTEGLGLRGVTTSQGVEVPYSRREMPPDHGGGGGGDNGSVPEPPV